MSFEFYENQELINIINKYSADKNELSVTLIRRIGTSYRDEGMSRAQFELDDIIGNYSGDEILPINSKGLYR